MKLKETQVHHDTLQIQRLMTDTFYFSFSLLFFVY
jgi:hypothetical protein